MESIKRVRVGVLLCSLATLMVWAVYLIYEIIPNIQRLPEADQEYAWSGIIFHLPGMIPAFLGLILFRRIPPDKKFLHLYLVYFGIFLFNYIWASLALGPFSGVLPLLLLWSITVFLLFFIFHRFRKKFAIKN